MSSFSDSVFDKIYLLAVEWGCLLLDIQTLEIVQTANRLVDTGHRSYPISLQETARGIQGFNA